MYHDGGGFWSLRMDEELPGSVFEYRYEFRDDEGSRRVEPSYRCLRVGSRDSLVWDHWLAPELPTRAFLRQAFAGVIFRPSPGDAPAERPVGRNLRITLRAPRVTTGHQVCLTGAHPLLGDWDPARARPMSGVGYPVWELELPAEQFTGVIEFKFGLWDVQSKRLVEFEDGENRWFHGVPPGAADLAVNYEEYRHWEKWRGAGVAVPVFSLRTEKGYGIGEFADLALFAKWAAHTGLRLVQLLPVNDTSSDFSWGDSYPYKAISTAALHPVYLNIERVFADSQAKLPDGYVSRRDALNRAPQLDYEVVLREKLNYLRALYKVAGKQALTDAGFQRYLNEHAHWLQPYAAFCRLRDLHGSADFNRWGTHAKYDSRQIRSWFEPRAAEYEEVMFHCWVQFHLDRQLAEALAAGHALGVAFKGDLPIGIDRSSVEAWTEPDLFRMDRQTGAPPDAFAVLGQNWRFPTYNWPRMEADAYSWWRKRFRRMSTAFDAIRIDHILGFFRIWEIPIAYREGIMGHYHPALPLSCEELQQAGFARDPIRFASGTVASSMLPELFSGAPAGVYHAFLAEDADGFFRLRKEYASPESRRAWYEKNLAVEEAEVAEAGITRLGFEVLFREDPDQPGHFHPRINLADTLLFRSLPDEEQAVLRRVHDDFYHHRHTRFWADEAMKKLPILMDASNMLICGEDLGMVPESVPIVLSRLGLLSLEVQRWPKNLGQRLGDPSQYPYLSVCTTSTHDMSSVRGWWEEDPETRQYFWAEVMGREGIAESECSPGTCRFIVEQNLSAMSMWCILPLQDWLGIDGKLRHPVASEERINIPAIPRHYWRYRMHLTVEALLKQDDFNRTVRELTKASGRQ
jgi:4-alpha-glucanotransferase